MQPTIHWENYDVAYRHLNHSSVTGTIKVAKDITSPQQLRQRDILVYLPPSYIHNQKKYPVLYMHDGQNLFDRATSYVGEWGVDETMEKLSQEEGIEAIVVGIPNAGDKRLDEYSPFQNGRGHGGQGELYLDYLTQTIKPMIDRDFRTLPERDNTGIIGSSMGALISLYAFFRHTAVFGFAGMMSPAFQFAQEQYYNYIQNALYYPGKLYMDVGTRESGGSWADVWRLRHSRAHYGRVRRMKRILIRKGYRPVHDLLYVEEKWAKHNEQAWARRLPQAIRFFYQNTIQPYKVF